METPYVFVYGSLKRGFRLHEANLMDTEFIGPGMLQGFTLHKVQGAWYPGIQEGLGKVKGEVFRIDRMKLEKLDQVEGVGFLYDRITADIDMDDAIPLSAFVYVYKETANLGPVMENGLWEEG